MKKIFVILALAFSTALSSQTTTVNTTTSVTATNQTVTTQTIKKDTLVSLQSFTENSGSFDISVTSLTANTTGILITESGLAQTIVFNLTSATNFNITGADSIRVSLNAKNRNTSASSTNTIMINGVLVPKIGNTNITYTTNSIVGSIIFTVSVYDANSGVVLDSLKLSIYTHVTTTANPTPTTTTGMSQRQLNSFNKIYSFDNTLFVIGDITEGTNFSVTDINGKEVIKLETLNSENKLIGFTNGIYLVQVFNSNNTLVSYKKILIQN